MIIKYSVYMSLTETLERKQKMETSTLYTEDMERIKADCARLQKENGQDAEFWGGVWPLLLGNGKAIETAGTFGETNLYVDDSGRVYIN